MNIYIYIYTRIFARATRALDSLIPTTWDITSGKCPMKDAGELHAETQTQGSRYLKTDVKTQVGVSIHAGARTAKQTLIQAHMQAAAHIKSSHSCWHAAAFANANHL